MVGFPSKEVGLFIDQSVIFRSDSNGEDLEGYAGAGLYDRYCIVLCCTVSYYIALYYHGAMQHTDGSSTVLMPSDQPKRKWGRTWTVLRLQGSSTVQYTVQYWTVL